MANICLPKEPRERLTKALRDGDITIARLYDMSDAERRTIFKQYVGEDFATVVNAKFEQAMVSNQKNAIRNWVERVTTAQEPVRRDMLKKVEKIQKVLTPDEEKGFLSDLAEQKLGLGVSEEEAKAIIDMKARIDDFKAKIPENAPIRSPERMAYGLAVDTFKEFVGKLKLRAESLTAMERLLPKNWWTNVVDAASITKSLVATLDNSFIGRQGIKVLLDGKYKIWGNAVAESFKNIGKELTTKSPGLFKERSDAVMAAIRADVFSRPNALNGKYRAAKNGYGLGVLHEEAFPSSLPERIPLLGRVFKASESAFNGSALRMRADLADAIIANAEKNGVDMLDPVEATAHGNLVSSLTGRGELGKVGAVGKELNALLFSVRFLVSNFNTLTAHMFDDAATPAARKVAAFATLRIAASLTALLSTAKLLGFDVEFDPRNSRFAKICNGNHCFDPTGGMSGLVTLGSRIVPTYHDGEWGFWTKSGTTGKWTKMSQGEFGEQTALDTFEAFFEGKLSPGAGVVRDVWKGERFGGEKPTFVNTTLGLITPISAQMLMEELSKGNDDIVLAMLAETLGISTTQTTFLGTSKKWKELREKEGEDVMNQSLKKVTENFNKRAEALKKSARWSRMSNDERSEELDAIRTDENNKIFNRYGIE